MEIVPAEDQHLSCDANTRITRGIHTAVHDLNEWMPNFLDSKPGVHCLDLQSVLRIGCKTTTRLPGHLGTTNISCAFSRCTTTRPAYVVPKPSCGSGLNSYNPFNFSFKYPGGLLSATVEIPSATMNSLTDNAPEIMPRGTMLGHTDQVRGVLHLPGGRRIITCSKDGSLRLWDLKSGAQIGDDWRDEGDQAAVLTIALSPNGNTVAGGSDDGKVRLWDVETGKVIAKWTGHTDWVRSVCWSADGQRVVSGSDDGTARVWNVKSGEIVLEIKTKSKWVLTVIYSPNSAKIATGVHKQSGVKIWDSTTGKLLATLKHNYEVWSVVSWTSDGQKLVSASYGSIRIFDTTTWQRIATLEGGTFDVQALCLSQNGRLLASAAEDKTVHLWNLSKSIPVGPPLRHTGDVNCAAFSADGKLLVTGCDNNVYVWDICGILTQAGLEDLLSLPHVVAGSSLMDSDATRRPTQFRHAHRGSPGFFDNAQDSVHSSATRNIHNRSSARRRRRALSHSFVSPTALFGRLPSLFRHSHPQTGESTKLQQRPRQSIFSRSGPLAVEVAAVQDRKPLAVASPRPVKRTQLQHSQSQAQASSSQTQPAAASTSATPAPGNSTITPGAATVQYRPIPLWARFVLFLCCASPPHANGH